MLLLGEDLIAPCHCKGTQKYVHRSCLDNWRSTKVKAFVQIQMHHHVLLNILMSERLQHPFLTLTSKPGLTDACIVTVGGFCVFSLYRV